MGRSRAGNCDFYECGAAQAKGGLDSHDECCPLAKLDPRLEMRKALLLIAALTREVSGILSAMPLSQPCDALIEPAESPQCFGHCAVRLRGPPRTCDMDLGDA